MKRYWPIAVVVAYVAFLLWLQPADSIVLPATAKQLNYPLPANAARYLTDDCDTLAYAIRAENAARGRRAGLTDVEGNPYEPLGKAWLMGNNLLDRYFLEYPPLALALFRLGHVGSLRDGATVPAIYLDGHQCFVAETIPETPDEATLIRSYRHSIRVYTVLLGSALIALMIFVGRCYPDVPLWLFLLPSFFYFSLCRFDILPAGLLLASITLADRKKPWASGLAMGLAVALKMYPLAVAPIVLRYAARSWSQAFVWCVMMAVPIMASYGWFYSTDGLEGIVVPLKFQLSRGLEPDWCFLGRIIPVEFAKQGWMRSLPVLMLSLVYTVRRAMNVEVVLQRCAVVVLLFISLQTFFSPQWGQWIVLLLLPLARKHPWLIGWLVFHDIWTYVYFPLIYDTGLFYAEKWDYLGWVSATHTWTRFFLYLGLVGGLMLGRKNEPAL